MVREDFGILILSHGRADNVKTISTLEKKNYTGKWYILIDNEDDQAQDYINNFGKEHIIIFDKAKAGKTFDIMDNFDGRQVPTFARNVCFDEAKKLGLKYFLELEDDYFNFSKRHEIDGQLRTTYVGNFDLLIDPYIKFLDESKALTVAFCQIGDLLGGVNSMVYQQKLTRKAMNAFFCNVERPFKFLGRFNDDVNAYLELGKTGKLFFTTRDICLYQPQTQHQDGGITDAYKQYGTYVKSFYSVMLRPDCVKISTFGDTHRRIHHRITWNNAVPRIINKKYKKGE